MICGFVGKNRQKQGFSDILRAMKFFSRQQKARKIASSLLVVWLSGFVLLFCCAATEARTEAEFCPLAKAKSHCDKTNKAKTGEPSFSNNSGLKINCCGFLPAVFDKTRKIEKAPQIVDVNQVKIDAPSFSSVERNFAVTEFYRPPEFDQKKIFITNCVFRI
ncbi:MAG TPA: hypothetical protein VF692_05925 [Pyrinomonadaceae bacterium]|jgi:hypothetical protein